MQRRRYAGKIDPRGEQLFVRHAVDPLFPRQQQTRSGGTRRSMERRDLRLACRHRGFGRAHPVERAHHAARAADLRPVDRVRLRLRAEGPADRERPVHPVLAEHRHVLDLDRAHALRRHGNFVALRNEAVRALRFQAAQQHPPPGAARAPDAETGVPGLGRGRETHRQGIAARHALHEGHRHRQRRGRNLVVLHFAVRSQARRQADRRRRVAEAGVGRGRASATGRHRAPRHHVVRRIRVAVRVTVVAADISLPSVKSPSRFQSMKPTIAPFEPEACTSDALAVTE